MDRKEEFTRISDDLNKAKQMVGECSAKNSRRNSEELEKLGEALETAEQLFSELADSER